MPGPKYGSFDFPSDFGFSGSATDRTSTTVRSHERRNPQRFQQGGRVKKRPLTPTERAGIEEENRPRPQKRIAGSLRDILGGQVTEREMKRLGLKKGGRAYNKGGMHRMPEGSMMKNSAMKKGSKNC